MLEMQRGRLRDYCAQPAVPTPLPSPHAAQVARQPAMEALPLVMEPRSRLYTDPLVVLDFQVGGRDVVGMGVAGSIRG